MILENLILDRLNPSYLFEGINNYDNYLNQISKNTIPSEKKN